MKLSHLLPFIFSIVSAFAAPSVEYRATQPLVESTRFRDAILRSALLAKAKILEGFAYSTTERNRLVGTSGHNATVNWIKDIILKYPDYFAISLQPFDMTYGISANLTVNDVALKVFPVDLSPQGTASGQLVWIPDCGCDSDNFLKDLTGKVVLIEQGMCQSGDKVAFAGARGASAVIIVDWSWFRSPMFRTSLHRLSTPNDPYVPTGVILREAGVDLYRRLTAGEVLTVNLTTIMSKITTYNIVAQTIQGDQENVIHICGHSDSVPAGPGINDNGSGTISILEVAIQLTKFAVNNAVRFSWWSAEEEGLLGSSYYVSTLNRTELDKIRLLLNFDMMASPNYAFQIYDGDGSAFGESGPPGSAEAEAAFTQFFLEEMHENYTQIEFDGRSDYGPFLKAGVAAGGIAAGAEKLKTIEEQTMFRGQAGVAYDINYHAMGDTVKNLNMDCWITMTKAIAHMTATYARSFDSLPSRDEVAKRMVNSERVMSKKATGELWGV